MAFFLMSMVSEFIVQSDILSMFYIYSLVWSVTLKKINSLMLENNPWLLKLQQICKFCQMWPR